MTPKQKSAYEHLNRIVTTILTDDSFEIDKLLIQIKNKKEEKKEFAYIYHNNDKNTKTDMLDVAELIKDICSRRLDE